jgi:hypothetical protein
MHERILTVQGMLCMQELAQWQVWRGFRVVEQGSSMLGELIMSLPRFLGRKKVIDWNINCVWQ